jgi:hypothetical protein
MLPSSARRLDCVRVGGLGENTLFHRRVEILEQKVEKLETLPDRVMALEVQISEFRTEVRAEFSATRSELRGEIRELGETLRGEMRTMGEGLRGEMRTMNNETCAQMRVLHEEVIARFNLLEEDPRWKRTTAPRRPKQ